MTKKHLQDAPIAFFAYDLLSMKEKISVSNRWEERRKLLEAIVARAEHPVLLLSPVITFSSWEQLTQIRHSSREMGAEGIMLKRRSSTYQVEEKQVIGGNGRSIRW
ncbi:MAG: hypothetical protein WDN26_22075 [Chitinophagaceae bacterium]